MREEDRRELEKDPNGLDQHSPGAKLDAGKLKVGILFEQFPRALKSVCKVATVGAVKYSRGGWQHVENGFERYTDAMGRHQLEEFIYPVDEDTGLLHIEQITWNALARLELYLREKETKD